MKNFVMLIFGCLLLASASAQEKPADLTSLLLIRMEAKEDYKPQESKVLQCANYILSSPANKEDTNRDIAQKFILKWMMGTPDYSFKIDEDAKGIMDSKLLPEFMASLSKYVLENPADASNNAMVKLNGFRILLNYCANKENKVEMNKYLKKMIKANESGKLEKELRY